MSRSAGRCRKRFTLRPADCLRHPRGDRTHRKDYGITWNAPLETGGVLDSDKITFEFEVSAIRTA